MVECASYCCSEAVDIHVEVWSAVVVGARGQEILHEFEIVCELLDEYLLFFRDFGMWSSIGTDFQDFLKCDGHFAAV